MLGESEHARVCGRMERNLYSIRHALVAAGVNASEMCGDYYLPDYLDELAKAQVANAA